MLAATDPTVRPIPRDARTTGLLYLAVAVTGGLSFMVVRSRIFEEGSPAATLANILEHETLARAGIGLQLALVIVSALVALWFYRLFRSVSTFNAGAIAVFGLVNAVAHLGSAAFLATALQVALEPVGDASDLPHVMYLISDNFWGVANLFFGLWLIPMGAVVLGSRWAPRALGWLLVAGGVSYVLSGLLAFLTPNPGPLVYILTIPPTIAEFWMIGWLLYRMAAPHRSRTHTNCPVGRSTPRGIGSGSLDAVKRNMEGGGCVRCVRAESIGSSYRSANED
ncbi:DUF4386 domain-containing protein [Arthrobacter pigmenti]